MSILSIKRWVNNYTLLSIIICLSSFKFPETGTGGALTYNLPIYLERLVTKSALIVAVLMFLSIGIGFWKKKYHRINLRLEMLFFYIFSTIVIFTGGTSDLFSRFLFTSLLLLYFSLVISNMTFYKLKGECIVKSLYWGAIAFIFINILTYIFMPEAVVWNERLYGITAHPNFLGVASSIAFCLSLFLFTTDQRKTYKMIYFLSIVMSASVCFLSGSRTGMVGFFIAFVLFLFLNIKRFDSKVLFVLFSIGLLIFFFTNYSLESLDYQERGNTRLEAWAELWKGISSLQLIGKGRIGASENSYLFAMIAGGIMGALFFFSTVILLLIKVLKKTNNIQAHNIYVLLTGVLLCEAVLEGFLLDTISLPMFIFWVLLSFPIKKSNKKTQDFVINEDEIH